MSFRKNLEKIDFKGDFTIDIIHQIIAAHNAELERIAAGMLIDRVARETTLPMMQLRADQAHVRRNAND